MAARRAIFVAPFGELADARRLARLAAAAEARGWDGFFLWDHLVYVETRELADPWVAMTAIACATERVRIGPLVTPTPRRRIPKLARETVTLDRLSGGRLVLGVGIGGDRHGEFAPFGDPADPRERARLLDEGLERLVELWGGEFAPPPAQQPRIPVWVAARWPNRRPMRRAARWDGIFPIDLPGPEALAELVAVMRELRGGRGGPVRLRRDEPGRHRSGAVGAGGRDLVPDRLRRARRPRPRCARQSTRDRAPPGRVAGRWRGSGDGERRGASRRGAAAAWPPTARSGVLARVIELVVAVVAVIIAIGVLLVVLEANPSNDIVDLIHDAARWLVGPFKDFFTLDDRKLEVAVNWGLALLVYVLVGRGIASLLRRPRP